MATIMRKKQNLWVLWILCLSAAGLITFGCGGGGGGGGGGGSSHLTYSGISTPAEVTDANAQTLVAGAVDVGSSSNAFLGIASLTDENQTENGLDQPLLVGVTRAFKNAMGQIDFSPAENEIAAAIKTGDETIVGSCPGNPGSARVRVSVNDKTGAFSGSIAFRGYCEEGVSISGDTNFSGVIDVYSLEFDWFQLSFDYITGTSGSESVTMDGSIRYDFINYDSVSVLMTMMVRDNSAGKTCMVENYRMDMSGSYNVEMEISGRYYDPDYGYVDIETMETFVVMNGDDNPSSGVLVLTGKDNSSARLTALSNAQCRLEVDEDGDGDFKISDDMNWDGFY